MDAQDSGIPAIPGIFMGFFSIRVYLRNMGMSREFFAWACQFFNLIILLSYLFDNSFVQDIKSYQVSKSLTQVKCV